MSTISTSKSLVNNKNFEFGDWNILVHESHILQSRCTNSCSCVSENDGKGNLVLCDFCKYEKELKLPQLPEMTFPCNILKISHVKGFGIEFNALDALKLVDSKNDLMKVAVAEAWQDFRLEDSSIREVVKPFDWTYTTNYKGTLFGTKFLKISPTDDRINIEKLKKRERILFYGEVILFEDELADNGVAQLSVKIRIMPDSFFILLRFFLRVDNLMVRIIDTRIYHEAETNYLLREFHVRESNIKNLQVPPDLLKNPQELWNHLPTVNSAFTKIEFDI